MPRCNVRQQIINGEIPITLIKSSFFTSLIPNTSGDFKEVYGAGIAA
jgi:hypothetical protein